MNLIYNRLSICKWNCICLLKKIIDANFRQRLSKNRSLHNIHHGKRCFIVGNAPSLKHMDLSYIANEYVFTVNNIYRNSEIYSLIRSNFHVFIDPAYGTMDREYTLKYLNAIKSVNSNIKLFTSYKNANLPIYRDENNMYALFQHKNWGNHNAVDLSSNLLVAQNVVQTAIYIAIYMGFKDIYLIGCDMTSLYENLEFNASRKLVSHHIYDISQEDKVGYEKIRVRCDNTYMLEEYAKVFRIFKNIEKISSIQDFRVYNATMGGILDIFERVDYSTLF